MLLTFCWGYVLNGKFQVDMYIGKLLFCKLLQKNKHYIFICFLVIWYVVFYGILVAFFVN